MIAIIDYGAGNLTSVLRAMRRIGRDAEITADAGEIRAAERVVFPGVGAAGETMANLSASGLGGALREAFASGKPLLGICIGAQIVFERSEEDGAECLRLLPGEARKFRAPGLKTPQIGWNQVRFRKPHPIFEGVPDGAEFYFVNSYHPAPADEGDVFATTEYGVEFASVVGRGNLIATQFHLEKSGEVGLKMLDRYCEWDGRVQ